MAATIPTCADSFKFASKYSEKEAKKETGYIDARGEGIGEVPQPGRFLYGRPIVQDLFE